MVRASSRQSKATYESTATAELNGHQNGTVAMMDIDISIESSKTVATKKVVGGNLKSSKVPSKIEDKMDTDSKSSPKSAAAASKKSRKRKNMEEEATVPEKSKTGKKNVTSEVAQQPQSKRAKVEKASPSLCLTAPDITGGVVLAVGMGDIGQLGLGPDVEEKTRVALVPGLPENIVAVAAGGLHTACLTKEGKVYTWGCNDEGGLGRTTGCEEENFSAGLVEGIEGKVVAITTGDCHTAALTEGGAVYAWGCFRDNNGPLGFMEHGNLQRSPRLLPTEPVTSIGSGNNHLALLGQSGRLYTCGCGESGQLGRLAEVFATRDARKKNGFDVLLVPAVVKVFKARRAVLFDGVWAGGDNTFARDAVTGDIYACGLNNYNQIGEPDSNTKFQPVVVKAIRGKKWQQFSCGQHHSIALQSSGQVYSMGRHDYGRLGLGEDEKKDAITPTPIPTIASQKTMSISAAGNVSLLVTDKGTAYGFGMGTSNQLSQGGEDDCWEPTPLTGKQLAERRVVAVSVGGQHSVLLAVPSS